MTERADHRSRQGDGSSAPPRVDYQALFELGPMPQMVLDRGLRIVAANAAYLRATGTCLEDILGRMVFDVFPNDPSDPDNTSLRLGRESLERVRREGKPDTIAFWPYRIPARDPSVTGTEERYWSATHTPIFDDRGEVAFILEDIIDVTDLQESAPCPLAEASVFNHAQVVQEANRRLKEPFMQAPVGISIVRGRDLIIEQANLAACRTWGRTASQVLGKPFLEALPEMRGQGFDHLMHEVIATGVPFVGMEQPAKFARCEGEVSEEEVCCNFVYEPLRDSSGKVDGVIVVGSDVTKMVRARQRAEMANEERIAFALKAGGLGHWQLDLTTGLVECSDECRKNFGLPVGRVSTHEYLVSLIHPDDRAARRAAFERAITNHVDYEAEYRVLPPDGGTRWVLVRGRVKWSPEGKPVSMTGVTLDTTERKVAELGVLRARHEAESFAAQEKGRADFEQQLIGIVSHDLRNPLNAILLATSALARRDDLNERTARFVLRIQSAADRASRMVRDLLDFTQARVGSGIPINRRPTDLHEITRGVLDEVEAACPGREVRLSANGDLHGEWDSDRVAQLVQNLVTNALQYSPEGTPVHVEVRGANNEVTLSVRNEGAPIQRERIAHLFEPLQRATVQSDGPARSVGLGLYIVRHLVEAHQGSIDVKSTAEEGTVFTVRLPRFFERVVTTLANQRPPEPPLAV